MAVVSPTPTSELKLKKVVLFKVGIGSFQKYGKIDLNQTKTLRLSFKDTVMNDLLKTFSILRMSGDLLVSGVSYEAKDTNKAKLLEDSMINLPEQNAFTTLLKQLRGINVRIDHGGKKVEGKVLGTQRIKEAPTGQAIIDIDQVILTFENGEIKPISINEINGLEIVDSSVDKDLKYFLETVIGQNREKNKTITLFLEGTTTSEFILNFLQETPAWKTTYRMYLEDKEVKETVSESNNKANPENKEKSDATSSNSPKFEKNISIQSWAIIDNVLDEDWENVDLTLVTGLPISFNYDSYSPAWIIRPTVERKVETSVAPVQFERDMMKEEKPRMKKAKDVAATTGRAMGGAPGAPPMQAPMARSMAAPCPPKPAEFLAELYCKEEMAPCADEPCPEPESAFEATSEAEGGKGVAFKYHIKNPVFVKRNNSSLIPILQSQIEGILVSVYNKTVNDKHPLITIEFVNKSGATLEEGPISVFINKNFAGEAMLPFLEQSAKARIPYSVDQAVEVIESNEESTSTFHKIEVRDSVYMKYFRTTKKSYKLKNFNDETRKVIIEHPKIRGFSLFETLKPDEETPNFYRFHVTLTDKETRTIEIQERKVDISVQQTAYQSFTTVRDWLEKKLITPEESEYLIKMIEMMNQHRENQDKLNKLNTRLQAITTEQDRLRENLRALKESSQEVSLRDKYIQKMSDQETEWEQIQKDIEKLTQEITKLDQSIAEFRQKWIVAHRATKEE